MARRRRQSGFWRGFSGQKILKFLREQWLSLGALVISLLALFVSWQANQIARTEFTSQMVVLDSTIVAADFSVNSPEGGPAFGCIERLRFANTSNAADSIVSFDTIVYYENTVSRFDGHMFGRNNYDLLQENSRFQFDVSEELSLVLVKLNVNLARQYAYGGVSLNPAINDEVPAIEFPLHIEGYTSSDYEIATVFYFHPSTDFDIKLDGEWIRVNPVDFPLLEYEITFYLASGQTFSTNRNHCGGATPR